MFTSVYKHRSILVAVVIHTPIGIWAKGWVVGAVLAPRLPPARPGEEQRAAERKKRVKLSTITAAVCAMARILSATGPVRYFVAVGSRCWQRPASIVVY